MEVTMAQITISEEHYQSLAVLAQENGRTPDLLANAVIQEQLERADHLAFWGSDIEERIAAIEHTREANPPAVLTDDEFLADLRSRLKDSNDATSCYDLQGTIMRTFIADEHRG
jgi:hypothetical protein